MSVTLPCFREYALWCGNAPSKAQQTVTGGWGGGCSEALKSAKRCNSKAVRVNFVSPLPPTTPIPLPANKIKISLTYF